MMLAYCTVHYYKDRHPIRFFELKTLLKGKPVDQSRSNKGSMIFSMRCTNHEGMVMRDKEK